MNLNEHLNDFLNYLTIDKNSSNNTVISYKKDISQYLETCNLTDVSELSRTTVRQFLSNIRELAPTTRSRKLSAIRSFMQFLVREGILEKNFGLEVDKPRLERKLPKIMTVNDTAKYIDAVDNLQDRAILETLYGVGCRVQELVSMKKSDIDFDNRTVRLYGKGNKERSVPINNSAINAIMAHLDKREMNSNYIFASRSNPNEHMSTRNAHRRVVKHTGGEMHPHMFRHSYATHLHANGVDIRVIQELLGHSDINTTTIYTSLANEQVSSAYRHAHPRG